MSTVGKGVEEIRKGSGEPVRSPWPLSRIKEVVFSGCFHQAQPAGELGSEC